MLSSVLFIRVFIICTLLYCIHIYIYNFYPNKSNQIRTHYVGVAQAETSMDKWHSVMYMKWPFIICKKDVLHRDVCAVEIVRVALSDTFTKPW